MRYELKFFYHFNAIIFQHHWTQSASMQGTIILLVEQIVDALGTEFRGYLPQIVPQILRVFKHDTSEDGIITAKVDVAFTSALQQYN